MYLENVVFDAVEPQRLGRFWEAALGTQRLTDSPDGFETRLAVDGGPELDLCFQRVPEPTSELLLTPRLRLHLLGGAALTDPEGNTACVIDDRARYPDTGPLAALSLDCAEPERDARFWSWLTGWRHPAGDAPRALRHPSLRGPFLELRPERSPKGTTKNRLHLDVRLETGDDPDDVAAGIAARGGRELPTQALGLAWRIYADASGNEFCVLPVRP